MKVDFMIIGAQKSGTTSLYRLLEQHPSLCFSKTKEPNFWCDKDWSKGIDAYHSLFQQKENVLYGEASTSYTLLPFKEISGGSANGRFSSDKLPYKLTNIGIWDDLYEYNPSLKFIYIVRRPFERIVSNYKHFYQRGYINSGLDDAVVSERFLIDFTRYYTQISPYLERFGKENVLLLNFDDLKNNQLGIVKQVTEFLGINMSSIPDKAVHANKTTTSKTHYYFDRLPGIFVRLLPFIAKRKLKGKPVLSETSKKIVATMLKHEIDMLGKIMGKDLHHWLEY